MSNSAHVASFEAVARFTAALRQFHDEASSVLLGLDQQIERALHWLDHEQPAYWRQQIRKQYDDVARTRTAWENCMLRIVAGDRPSCIEEEKAHRTAKRKLEAALAKPEEIRRWSIKVHQEVDEYRGRIGKLRHALESSVPKTIALLYRARRSRRLGRGYQRNSFRRVGLGPPPRASMLSNAERRRGGPRPTLHLPNQKK